MIFSDKTRETSNDKNKKQSRNTEEEKKKIFP